MISRIICFEYSPIREIYQILKEYMINNITCFKKKYQNDFYFIFIYTYLTTLTQNSSVTKQECITTAWLAQCQPFWKTWNYWCYFTKIFVKKNFILPLFEPVFSFKSCAVNGRTSSRHFYENRTIISVNSPKIKLSIPQLSFGLSYLVRTKSFR